MRNTDHATSSSLGRAAHLTLVGAAGKAPSHHSRVLAAESSPAMTTVRQLTHAMMNRLWVPHTTTIVGLLGVGLSRTNFDELSKWIVTQLATVPSGGAANDLPHLEHRFRRAVDDFPEL